jgi:hypothetical protein
LTGCGRQVSKDSTKEFELLATGPDVKAAPAPPSFVTAALDATGGLAAWEQCKRIGFRATVTACEGNGCFYLTEHNFALYPWSAAVRVTAHEPRADFTWQVVGSRRYTRQADPNLDVSPLRGLSWDYAEAVLQMVAAPVHMLEDIASLTIRPAPVQIAGQWFLPIDANYQARTGGPKDKAPAAYWTQETYFQSQSGSRVDMIWLGNPGTRKFVMVRGYDYARDPAGSILIPTKIEVFQSDPEANLGPRLALIDVER